MGVDPWSQRQPVGGRRLDEDGEAPVEDLTLDAKDDTVTEFRRGDSSRTTVDVTREVARPAPYPNPHYHHNECFTSWDCPGTSEYCYRDHHIGNKCRFGNGIG